MIKHMFNLVAAPENEIKYLCKVKSVVMATARDILNNVLQSIKGQNMNEVIYIGGVPVTYEDIEEFTNDKQIETNN